MPEKIPHPLVAVADLVLFGGKTAGLVESAARGGVKWVLLRAKGLPREELLRCAREVAERCPGLFVSIHGDAKARSELSLPCLHLPSGRMESFRAGQKNDVLLGVSCHNAEEIEGAARDGADYAFLSPLFPPSSKESHLEPLGAEKFRELARASRIPLIALGGIAPENAVEAFEAGAAGIAVCGALFNSPDVEKTARRLVKITIQVKR